MLSALIGQDTNTGDDVCLDYEDRPRGVAIIGKPGSGKSSLLEHLILTDLENSTPGVVIDPHGLLAERVIMLAPPEHAERIILLNPSETTFGLNLLACRTVVNDDDDDDPVSWAADSVVQAVKRLYGEDDGYLPRLEHYLDLAVRALIPNNGTLLHVTRLLRNQEFRSACLRQVTDELVLEEWRSYDSLRPIDQVGQIEAVANRLGRLLRPPLIRGIVGCSQTTVPFDSVLAGNKMLILSVPSDRLSQERCDFIGTLVLCALADRIFLRQATISREPERLHIYVDEYQRFATTTTRQLIEQGRKYGSGVAFAHQSLSQISDPKLRNASRQVGTLVALALTGPDADLLAGEFPIKPREEWTETIEELEGSEPILVFSPTPAEDIYLNGHSDEYVDLLARVFLGPSRPWTIERIRSELGVTRGFENIVQYDGDPRKSAGIPPRPSNGKAFDARVQVSAYDVNELLVDAMAGKLQEPHALLEKLLWAQPWWPRFRLVEESGRLHEFPLPDSTLGTLYFPLTNHSPSLIPVRDCDCHERIDDTFDRGPKRYTIGDRRSRAADDPLGLHLVSCTVRPLTHDETIYNEAINHAWREDGKAFIDDAVRQWLRAHLQNIDAIRANKYPDELVDAENYLLTNASVNFWNWQFQWYAEFKANPDGSPRFIHHKMLANIPPDGVRYKDLELTPEEEKLYDVMLFMMRLRLQFLVDLCEGLYRQPVMIKSGEQRPRMRARHIVHSAQTYQDAFNEFATKLVHPSQQHGAHSRLPAGYHQVQLQPPIPGKGNSHQFEAALERAMRYECSDTDGQEPSVAPVPPGPLPSPRISRYPGPTTDAGNT